MALHTLPFYTLAGIELEVPLMNWRTVALKTAFCLGVVVGLVLLAPRAKAQEDATATTRESNASIVQQLSFQDSEDFEDAGRGFVATLPDATIKSADGRVIWSLKDYEFLKDKAPPTVNPSLWRVARLNLNHGLFKVTDRIYQIRGFDISNMDIIEGDTGLIVIDPLISAEVARAGLTLLTVTDFGGLDVGIPQAMRRSIDFAANSHGIGAG